MPKITLTYTFESEEELHAHLSRGAAAPVVTDMVRAEPVDSLASKVITEPVTENRAAAEPEVTADVDADGLPYDPEIHASPKSFVADGLWRAKRGKADQANAARAAFKAAGGAVPSPAMPALPGMPGVAVDRAPEPISYDKLIDKTLGMMQRAKVTSDRVMELYGEIGLTDPAALETNESMRAALFGKLCEIEPELS